MELGVEGNAALVAASSSGLGTASARALAREGADVVINGRDEDALEAAADEIREVAAGRVVAQPGDLTVAGDVEALVDRTVDELGGLDHLVTNAGGPPSGPFVETSDED
jgi:3-oxoacyl-[acyl-carrier protein] reductase